MYKPKSAMLSSALSTVPCFIIDTAGKDMYKNPLNK